MGLMCKLLLVLITFVVGFLFGYGFQRSRSIIPRSRESLLNYLQNEGNSGWSQISSEPGHFYYLPWEDWESLCDTGMTGSCEVRPRPFPEPVELMSGWQEGKEQFQSSCEPSRVPLKSKFGIAHRLKPPTLHIQGTYKVHVGYYCSGNRTYNLSLVGLELEVVVEYDQALKGFGKIRRVGVSYKFQDVIFQYPDVAWFGRKVPQLGGQCWNFHAPDLTQKKISCDFAEPRNQSFADCVNALLPYHFFLTYKHCLE